MVFHSKTNWTFIIPAAGRSTRFKSKESKLFYRINKMSIIENIINKIEPFCKKIILIIREEHILKIKKIFKKKENIVFVIQKKPNGMATAINLGLKNTKTIYSAILWADQIGLTEDTIKKTIYAHTKMKNLISLPIFQTKNPYTLIKFKKNKLIKNVIQSREEEIKLKSGFKDCGFFCVNSKQLEKELKSLIKNKKIIANKTKEFDFLKSFEHLSKKNRIFSIITKNKVDSLGINSFDDVKTFKKCQKFQ